MTTTPTDSATPILSAFRRQPLPRTPVWLMRQAGRYLPEYQKVRRASGGFLAMAQTPELAAEVTLQPVTRFDVDAAILFSDILLPLQAMGMELRFEEGRGPVFPKPLASRADVDALEVIEPGEALGYVGEALRLTRAGLSDDKTLLGFAGAPFTLAAYALAGSNPAAGADLRTLMYRDRPTFDALMDKLALVVGRHLAYQIECGAQAVVLFDTWAGQLTRDDYLEYAAPFSRRALEAARGLATGGGRAEAGEAAPLVAFVRAGGHLLGDVVDLGVDAIALDWRVPIGGAFDRFGDRVAFQGNLDPAALLATPDEVYTRARKILAEVGGRPGHVLSLGHGVMKQTDPESVAAFVAAAKETT